MKTVTLKSPAQTHRTVRYGFTLTELLVVIVVIAVLATLRVSMIASAKNQTKIGQCAANLRQLALVTQIYANENKDKLPVWSGGNWAWDLPSATASSLLASGAQKKTFYCPGTAPRFTDWENYLAPGTAINGNPACLWNFGYNAAANTGIHIIGYVLAFSGPSGSGIALASTNQNATMLPEPVQISFSGFLRAPASKDRVLVADATIQDVTSGSFTDVVGGFYLHHLSPHLKGTRPAGGNLAFKDGHVQWRKFSDMSLRTVQGQNFWW